MTKSERNLQVMKEKYPHVPIVLLGKSIRIRRGINFNLFYADRIQKGAEGFETISKSGFCD